MELTFPTTLDQDIGHAVYRAAAPKSARWKRVDMEKGDTKRERSRDQMKKRAGRLQSEQEATTSRGQCGKGKESLSSNDNTNTTSPPSRLSNKVDLRKLRGK